MKRLAVPVVSAVVAIALVALLGYGLVSRADDTSIEQAVADGDRPPAASRDLPLLGAKGMRSLADLRGQVVVLNFWASWCPPCEAEAPVLEAAQRRLQREGKGTVLGVTYQDLTSKSLKFVKDHGISYPNVRDIGTKLAERYGTKNLPDTFVIDAQGRVADLYRGQISQQRLDQALDKVL